MACFVLGFIGFRAGVGAVVGGMGAGGGIGVRGVKAAVVVIETHVEVLNLSTVA